jgi:outer membrane assembly lipoprotein YfiO
MRALIPLSLLLVTACTPSFRVQSFTTDAALYAAAERERTDGREENAIAAYERLQVQLSPNDTLLPIVHQRLGAVHSARKQWLLAAQAFLRIPESFPDHPLADTALLAAGDAYAKLWRGPELDAKHGLEALATYNLLIRQYPSSRHLTAAGDGAARMREQLARKDVLVGDYYYRRKAFDSAIIYYEDAAAEYPGTEAAKDALMQIVRSFRALKYAEEDARLACERLRREVGADPKVDALCPPPRAGGG